jgi:glycosyltransferase involved in cell wall biosynthesis
MGVRFSVLIPVFNREKYFIRRLIRFWPRHSPIGEVLAVDDGSTDRSAEELRSYGDNKK